jgi:hypothetical protein
VVHQARKGFIPINATQDKLFSSFEEADRAITFCPPGTDPEPLIERLCQNVRIPVTAVRAYRGTTVIYERKLQMRGS